MQLVVMFSRAVRRRAPRRGLAAALFAAVLLALTGCGEDVSAGAGAADGDARVNAVAAVFPLAWIAREVAPDAEVVLLADGEQDPHDTELGPRERERLERADVVLYMGEIDYQAQVETAVSSATGRVLDVAETIGRQRLRTRHDEAEHDGGHGDGGGVDPHVWFDPASMARVAEEAGEVFAAADPSGESRYRANAATLARAFSELETDVAERLGDPSCTHDYVVVSHEAYGYLLEPFGYDQQGLSAAGGHAPASSQRIAELVETMREDGVGHVLAEPVEGRQDAEALAAEVPAEVVDIHSLEVPPGTDERGFPELLRAQAETVATAAGCDG